MVNVIPSRTAAAIGSVGAVLATLAMAPSAHASTYYACVKKKGGSIRIVSRTTRCKRSERKIWFNNEGPPGMNGLNGRNGRNGLNGLRGTNGISGTTGFTSTLPEGATEAGTWAVSIPVPGAISDAISFNIPLAGAPTVNVIPQGGLSTTACPGKVAAPEATTGNLCIYTASNLHTTIRVVNPSIEGEMTSGASPWGAFIEASSASAPAAAYGTWAVTG